MSPEPCHRVRDALAAGNVWGDAVLLEHAKSCEVCTSELAVLKKKRDFKDAFPTLSSIADQSKRPPSPVRASSASRRHLLIMILTVIAIIGFFIRSRERPAPPEESGTVMAPPRYRISNIENALFESKVEGQTVRSSMTRGVAAFHVEPLRSGQRFLLTLPDGDLEVRGTRFVVTIEGGRTQGIDVAEGTVALRLQGRQEMLLSGGDRWPSEGSSRPTVHFMRLGPKDAAATEPSGDGNSQTPGRGAAPAGRIAPDQ
jgi:hypothetical protein